jgi:hypothetical protein
MSDLAPLTIAEVRDLVAEFYRKFDVHAPAEEFISILAEEGLKMVLAHGEVRNFEDFRAWYDPLIRSFFDSSHEIYDVELVSTSVAEAKAKVVLVWDAKAWIPPAAKSDRISILTYTTFTVRRSSKTRKPVLAAYLVDDLKYLAGTVQTTPDKYVEESVQATPE